MLEGFLETSRAYDTKIKDLRIQVATFCLYNLLITYTSFVYDDLSWEYSLAGSHYASQIGIELTAPTFTPKFNIFSGYLNFVFSVSTAITVIVPTPDFRYYLLPDIIWNVYTVTNHLNNILELTYDIFKLSGHPCVACNLFLTGTFTITLHMLLLIETIIFYDRLNYVPKSSADFIIWEIEEHFTKVIYSLKTETETETKCEDVQRRPSEGGDAFE